MKTVYLNMKATKAAIFCALFLFCSLAGFAQTTARGFNYQAIARDASGNPVVNKGITVELSIRKDNDEGTIVWQETHSTSTNEYGLFTLVIGQGTSTGVGTLSSMNMVNWSTGYYYVQVWMDFGSGLTDMGTTELQSVPYAMMADSAIAGPKYPLSQLPDVNATGLTANMILMWNGTQWVPVNPATTIEGGLMAKIESDSAYLTGLINTETTNRMNGDNNIAHTITTDSAVLTTMITNTNSALTTFEGLPSGQMYVGNSSNMAAPVTMTGDATLTNVGMVTISNNAVTTAKILDGSVTDSKIMVGVDATKIADGSVSNTDFENISSTKGNLQSQITANANNIATNTASINAITNLPSGEMYVGNASNTGAQVSMSGDATMSNTGAITVANGAITDVKVAPGINADKIANGLVTNTQFQYLQGASSNIQSQINAFGNIALTDEDSIRSLETQVSATTASISSLQTQVATNTTNIATAESNITNLQAGVQSLNTTTQINMADIDSLQSQVTANTGNIATDESNITGLQTQVTTNTTNIGELEGGVETLYGRTASLQNQINTNDTTITTLQNQVNANSTSIATAETNITTLRTGVQSLNNSVAGLNTEFLEGYSDIMMLNTSVQNIIDTLDNIGTAVAGNTASIATDESNIAQNTNNINALLTLPAGDIVVGNSNNMISQVPMTGDASISNTGAITINDSAITDVKVAGGINASKIADGSVSNTIFEYLDGATSNIQNQLNTIGVAEATDATSISMLQTQVNTNTDNIATIQTSLDELNVTTTSLSSQLTTTQTTVTILGEELNSLVSLPAGDLYIGNTVGEATRMTLVGDATLSSNGTLTIDSGAVTGYKIAAATITGANIAANTVGIGNLATTGTADSTKFLRGDGTWAAPAAGGGSSTTFNGTTVYASQSVTTDSLNGTIVNSPTVNTTNLSASNVTSSNVVGNNFSTESPFGFGTIDAVPLVQTISTFEQPVDLSQISNGVNGISPVIAVIQNISMNATTVTYGMTPVGTIPGSTMCVYLKTGTNTYTLIEQGLLF